MKDIPEKLIIDRREMDSLNNVHLLEDAKWDKGSERWYLQISIEITNESKHIPKITKWVLTAERNYPHGSVKIHPALENSITVTFPHQSNNSHIAENGLWRKGDLCLEVDISSIESLSPESKKNKLLWYIKRAVLWLEAASTEKLVDNSSLFEFPQFILSKPLEEMFVFSEDVVSLMQWESRDEKYGIAWLDVYKLNPSIYYVKSFNSNKNTPIRQVEWGHYLARDYMKEPIKAIWILLDKVPVLNIWQPPNTYKELEQCFKEQGLSLSDLLEQLSPHLRNGRKHLLLLGYPMPEFFHGENNSITWQALRLPVLSCGKCTAKGFRSNEVGWRMRDNQEVFKKNLILDWVDSQNWGLSQINQRGKFSPEITRKKVLLIGSGCVGSAIAELLVRSSAYNITLLDYDIFEVGNLSRHTLSLADIGSPKTSALSERLNSINPHARVVSIHSALTNEISTDVDFSKYDIIIDCSGANEVLLNLEKKSLREKTVIMSISISLEANYIYIGLWKNRTLCMEKFIKNISEYLEKDRKLRTKLQLPRDGVGCWHPTFPARADDIWSAAAIATKALEKTLGNSNENITTLVYKKIEDKNYFNGYLIVKRCEE